MKGLDRDTQPKPHDPKQGTKIWLTMRCRQSYAKLFQPPHDEHQE